MADISASSTIDGYIVGCIPLPFSGNGHTKQFKLSLIRQESCSTSSSLLKQETVIGQGSSDEISDIYSAIMWSSPIVGRLATLTSLQSKVLSSYNRDQLWLLQMWTVWSIILERGG